MNNLEYFSFLSKGNSWWDNGCHRHCKWNLFAHNLSFLSFLQDMPCFLPDLPFLQDLISVLYRNHLLKSDFNVNSSNTYGLARLTFF